MSNLIMFNKNTLLIFLLFILDNASVIAKRSFATLDSLKNNTGMYSIVVSRDDKIVYERYSKKYHKQSLLSDQSLTKNKCSIHIDVAIDREYICFLDEKLSAFLPATAKKQSIKFIHQIFTQIYELVTQPDAEFRKN